MNRALTAAFDACFAVMESWPGWLSLIILAGVTGVIALVAFKYTSNQDAIGKVRDDIKASLLALKLFKDNLSVTFRSQGRLLWSAVRLFLYSLQPFAVMLVPMLLLIFQMGLRYEWRPLHPGEATIVTVNLRSDTPEKSASVTLTAPEGVAVEAGPTRIFEEGTKEHPARNAVAWRVRPEKAGRHLLQFEFDGESATKELSCSDQRYVRASPVRAGASFIDKLLYPAERPAAATARIQDIRLDIPTGTSPVFGWDVHWIITYFVASIVIALLIKPFLKVKI